MEARFRYLCSPLFARKSTPNRVRYDRGHLLEGPPRRHIPSELGTSRTPPSTSPEVRKLAFQPRRAAWKRQPVGGLRTNLTRKETESKRLPDSDKHRLSQPLQRRHARTTPEAEVVLRMHPPEGNESRKEIRGRLSRGKPEASS
ncbi:hypothetical protein HispidOSU_015898 [Sigmodon hispidus]